MFNLFKKQENRRSSELTDRLSREHWQSMNYAKHLVESKTHVLIGGQTGAGKSVLVRELLHHALAQPLGTYTLVLIDPKRVDLVDYKDTALTKGYAQEPEQALHLLKRVSATMEDRYQRMSQKRLKEYDGNTILVFIDELADLLSSRHGKAIKQELQHITQLGRASKIFVFACTQYPHRKVIPVELQMNFGSIVALRCKSAIDSRLMIQQAGAEQLPRFGYAYIQTPEELYLQKIDKSSEAEIKNRIRIAELIA